MLASVAVTTAVVCVVTAVGALAVKFAVDDPAFTVTEAGTVADPVLLCSETLVLLAAFPLNVTVHEEVAGGVILAGEQLTLESAIPGFNVRVTGFETDAKVAVMIAEVCAVTDVVVTVKFAVEDPELTVTVLGTVALPLLLCSDTLVSLAAFPLSVTVQLEEAGDVSVVGVQLKLDSTITGFKVKVTGFETDAKVAVMVAEVCVLTDVVVTVKFAVEDPEFTVTVLGTDALALLLCSETLVLLAAFPLNVTVQLEDAGGVSVVGVQLKLERTIAGVNVSVTGLDTDPKVAVMVAEVCEPTVVVVTVKFAVEDPEFTVTVLGTDAFPLLLCRETLVLLGAFALNVTVQLEEVGGVRVVGVQLKLDSTTGFNVRVTGFETDARVAVIIAEVCVLTDVVVTVKFAVDDPAFTVTVLGTVAFPLLLCSETLVLLAAFPLSVTVQLEEVGGVTVVGVQLKLESTITGFNVRVTGFETDASVAVMVAEVCVLTDVVVTVKFAVDDPEFTVTVLGTVAFPLVLCSDTLVLLAAFPLRVTVQLDEVGGVSVVGVQLKLDNTTAGGFNVRVTGFETDASVAVMVAEVCVLTAVVVTVKFAVDDPEFTVTVLGTVAFPLVLCKETLVLLVALPLNVTVQLEEVGGVSVVGVQLKLDSTIAGFNVNVTGLETDPRVAVIVAEVCELTAVVVTVKFAVDEPEFTVTVLGTVAFPLLLCSDTLVLLAAFPLKVTVQLEEVGGVSVVGAQFKLESTIAGFNVSVKGCELDPNVAVMMAVCCEPTAIVPAVKFPVDVPEFTVTVLGTVALALLLPSETLVLLATLALKVTVQFEEAGVVTADGLQLKLETVMVGWVIVTVPLPPVIEMLLPVPSEADAPVMLSCADVSVVEAI